MSQWQWLRSSFAKPRFSEPNKSATLASRPQPLADELRSLVQQSQWLVQFPIAGGRGPHHQRAVSHGFGNAVVLLGVASSGAAPTAERASRNDAS